jgi:uncharacterized membrane protein
VKERVVVAAHRLTIGVLTTISLLITGMVLLIFDVVLERSAALLWSGAVATATVLLVVVLPHILSRHD